VAARKGPAAPKPRKSAKQPPKAATKAATKAAQDSGKAKPQAAKGTGQARKARTDTKQARLIAMLRQPDGATIDDVAKAFGWQPHTVRGALYGALKKKLDLNVTSEKVEGRGRVYRIAG
jgi:hypothetical protein